MQTTSTLQLGPHWHPSLCSASAVLRGADVLSVYDDDASEYTPMYVYVYIYIYIHIHTYLVIIIIPNCFEYH